MADFVLGVDGGGTRTRVAVVGFDGRVRAIGVGGTSNYDDVGKEVAQANIEAAAQQAMAQAGVDRAQSAAIFLGMAGVTSATDQQHIRDIALALRLAPSDRIGVNHDCSAALAGGLEGRPGIVQILGTGSSCYGRNAAGESWMSGGRGQLISDEASGNWLGIQAMRMAVRAYDGRTPDTPLLPRVLKALEIDSVEDILHRQFVVGLTRAEIAALAPIVLATADEGDAVAAEILDRGAQEVAEMVAAVAHKLELDKAPICEVCVVGGVVEGSASYRARITSAVQRMTPTAQVKLPALPPVIGAAILALEVAGVAGAPHIQTV